MNISDVWGVLKIRVIFGPTPIYNGVKGKLVDKNSNGFILLLVAKVSTGSISFSIGLVLSLIGSTMVTLIGTIEILTIKSTISKFVPSLNGLIGFVIIIGYYFCLEIEMWEVALVVLILVSISTYTKSGGTYLNYGKAMW